MMKNVTIVLTITALAAALIGKPAPAQSLPSSLDSYDQTLASDALSATQSPLEESLLAAINSQRAANGCRALTWDPALAAAATYQETADVAAGYYGEQAVLADGRTTVGPARAAADFGSAAAAVAECESTSILQAGDYGNAALMVSGWKAVDPSFAALLSSGTPTACGIGMASKFNPRTGTSDYYWAVFYGTEGTAPAPAAPTLNTGGLNATFAAAALRATASTDETGLLAAINSTRAFYTAGPLTADAGLTAAAHYQAADDLALGQIALYPKWAYGADGATRVQPAALASDFASAAADVQDYVGSNDALNGAYLSMTSAGWARQVSIWRVADPSGFAAMLSSGVYNVCGVAVVADGSQSQGGTSYPVKYYVLLVGHK